MKPHWSENAGWQFLGVILSALGILISLLPENQRLLGFIISMVGMVVLAWVLLRKPVKRMTQQFTPGQGPRALRKSTAQTSQVHVRRHSTLVKEGDDTINRKFVVREKFQFVAPLLLGIGSITFAIWEVSLIQNHIESISSAYLVLPWNESSQYIKLSQAYTELYRYIEQILVIVMIGLTITNLCIVYMIIEVINFLLRILRKFLP